MHDDSYVEEIKMLIHGVYSNEYSYSDYLKKKYSKYKYVCVFGAGNIGRPTAHEMIKHDIRVDFFCDNDKLKQETTIDGLACISLDELCNKKEETMVIICGRAFESIFKQLTDLGFSNLDRLHVNKFRIRDYMSKMEEQAVVRKWISLFNILSDEESKIICLRILSEWCVKESRSLRDICTNDQYFCKDIIKMGQHEVVVDGGAYTGDTLKSFLELFERFDRYYMFELSKNNYRKMISFVSTLETKYSDRIICFNSGISNNSGKILYSESDEGASVINIFDKVSEGDVVTIDEVCSEDEITFIKMDIEGSELPALRGAKKCIRSSHPKLAICLYHRPEDIWEIPLYIKDLNPDYRIYIRHHTDLMNETVCYAVEDRV